MDFERFYVRLNIKLPSTIGSKKFTVYFQTDHELLDIITDALSDYDAVSYVTSGKSAKDLSHSGLICTKIHKPSRFSSKKVIVSDYGCKLHDAALDELRKFSVARNVNEFERVRGAILVAICLKRICE